MLLRPRSNRPGAWRLPRPSMCATIRVSKRRFKRLATSSARSTSWFAAQPAISRRRCWVCPPMAFKAVIDIDLLGTFNTCRAAYAHLRKPGATIISISASHASMPIANQSHVCAAKAGVDLLTRTLAVEWGPAGIRANCITPGPTDDTEGMRRLAPTAEIRRKVEGAVPLRRFGTKDELADLALFLCSDAAAYITGAVYVCDGGQSLVRSSLSTAESL